LICTPDSLQLQAIGNGTFEWGPAINILNDSTSSPIVYPRTTTVYTVTMHEKGCVATEQVNVRVVTFVTLDAGADTTICLTDTFRINPISDGLRFLWTADPSAYIENPTLKSPLTTPSATTRYEVVARIGSCVASDAFTVTTVPYPYVDAGPDKIICYDDTTHINGYTDGSSFVWQPSLDLINNNTTTPDAHPLTTRIYTLLGFDTLGCPKPGSDQVLITVRPEINAFAGNDTAVVINQPLQLNGSGAEFYSWSPEGGLSRTSISNPIAELSKNMTYIMKAYTSEGCFAYDTINIQVFKTMPDIFVPNAFAPTGQNNELRPKAVGISSLDYFRVFNRWGQMVFQTSQFNKGWDGRIGGVIQNTGTYVWMVSGTDYTGRKVIKRGTAVLIR
ncbi:MAG: gliding motility-associated C-terminal domain-containing protein, partial [Chitinophagaceae bacterium]|nr:gliding motility-associated C-terminal domain-containing protein [Chitinophagaceae bacterium]